MREAPRLRQLPIAATGDLRYVHKALVAFSRLAVEYAYLAIMTQHRHRNTAPQVERFGQGRYDEGPRGEPRGSRSLFLSTNPGIRVSFCGGL